MLWTDKIIEHAEKLNKGERKEYFKGLVEGFKMGNYLMPTRGDNHSSMKAAELCDFIMLVRKENGLDTPDVK